MPKQTQIAKYCTSKNNNNNNNSTTQKDNKPNNKNITDVDDYEVDESLQDSSPELTRMLFQQSIDLVNDGKINNI